MDAVEFIKEMKRLHKSESKCGACKLKESGCCIADIADIIASDTIKEADIAKKVEKAVQIVENWSKNHPIKTRQSEFLKMFPNADLKTITRLLPCSLDRTLNPLRCAKYGYLSITCRCDRCRYDYWNEEVTDND